MLFKIFTETISAVEFPSNLVLILSVFLAFFLELSLEIFMRLKLNGLR